MTNPQSWLHSQEQYNTEQKRNGAKKMTVCYNELEGELELSDFVNLQELDCAWNKLTSLNLNNCRQLKELWCGSNRLSNLDLNGLIQLKRLECFENLLANFENFSLKNLDQLTFLNLSDNNFPKQDLAVFSHLTNLQTLWIGNNDKERIKQDIYNRFVGSLKPLRNLPQLKKLDISNTDIDCGLEYLSDTLEEIQYSTNARPESKVKKIAEELAAYNNNIKTWRKINHNLINTIKNTKRLLVIAGIVNSALTQNIEEQSNMTGRNVQVLNILSFYLEEIIITTRKKLYQKKPLGSQNNSLFQENEQGFTDCKNFPYQLGILNQTEEKKSLEQERVEQIESKEELNNLQIKEEEEEEEENLAYQIEVQLPPKQN